MPRVDGKTTIRSRRSRLVGAGVLLVVLVGAVVALRGRVAGVGGAGALPGVGTSLLIIGLNAAGNLLLVDGWRALVAASGTRLSLGAAARVWTASQLARYTIGAAQVPGRALAGRRVGIGAAAGTLTTLVEIAWGTSLTAVLVLATAPAWLPGAEGLWWLAAAAILPTVVVVAGLIAPRPLLAGVAGILDGAPLRRLSGGRLSTGLQRVRIDRTLAVGVTGRYALVIALRVAATLALFSAVGGDLAADAVLVAGAWAIGQVVGQVAVFAPGGLGPREGATALVLTPAIGLEASLLLVALVRLGELVAELGCFGAARLASSKETLSARVR